MLFDAMEVYQRLYKHFGPQEWWPVFGKKDARFEICVGAVLTQNTAWTNVEKALRNLLARKLVNPRKLASAPTRKIQQAIRPAGYFNQKTKKLKLFSRFVLERGGFDRLFQLPTSELRVALLGVWGIGPETADSIILYAARKPVFVIDAYTKRLLNVFNIRHRTYEEYREFFESQLPRQVKLWNEYHALIVAWGKLFVRDRQRATVLINRK